MSKEKKHIPVCCLRPSLLQYSPEPQTRHWYCWVHLVNQFPTDMATDQPALEHPSSQTLFPIDSHLCHQPLGFVLDPSTVHGSNAVSQASSEPLDSESLTTDSHGCHFPNRPWCVLKNHSEIRVSSYAHNFREIVLPFSKYPGLHFSCA